MMKKATLTFFCTFFIILGYSQTKALEKKEYIHELGLNVTNLIVDLLGNNNLSSPGNYLISYKRLKGNKAFRMGGTANFAFSNATDLGFGSKLTNQNFQLRIGRETRQNISTRFQYYYGLDAIMGFKQEESNVRVNAGQVIQSDRNIILGGGPVLGFQFALYDRLLIGTEGSLYAAFNKSSVDFQTFGVGSGNFPSKSSDGVNIQTNLPKSLFLIVKF